MVLLKGYRFDAPAGWTRAQLLEEITRQAAARTPDASKALPLERRRRRIWKRGEFCKICRSTDTWVTRTMRVMTYPAVIEMRRRYHKCGHCGRNFRTEGPLI